MEDGVSCLDRDVILDKEVSSCKGCAKNELSNLEGSEGSLDCNWDLDVKCRQGEVGVLATTLANLTK